MTKQEEKKEQKIKMQEIAFNYLDGDVIEEYWHDINNDNNLYITIKENDNYKHIKVNSNLKRLILLKYYNHSTLYLSKTVLDDLLTMIEGRCMNGQSYQVYTRIANLDETIYYNLVNKNSEVVKITEYGCIVTKMPREIKMTAVASMLEQCRPDFQNSNLELLKEVANCGSKEDYIMLVVYLSYCIHGKAPFPVLNVFGEQGSGKSGLCNKLIMLANPEVAISHSLNNSEEDVYIAVKTRPIILFDNVSGFNSNVSDWLCKISTGVGFSMRKKYTDDDEHAFKLCAGIIINSLYNVIERADLIDRSIPIELPELEERESCHMIEDMFEQFKPSILGGVFQLISYVLSQKGKVNLDGIKNIPRMLDYCRFGTACEEYLGLEKGEFIRIYKERFDKGIEESLGSNLVIQVALDIIEGGLGANHKWEIALTELYNQTGEEIRDKYPDFQNFPKAPNTFSRLIKRHIQYIRKTKGVGITITRKTKGSQIVATRLELKESNIIEIGELKVGDHYIDEVGNKCTIQ